jgi:transcriptional regulator with XRE-family HTH domain
LRSASTFTFVVVFTDSWDCLDFVFSEGLTQAQLAQKMGLTLRAITYYEGESTNPSLQFIENAAKTLGVSQAALLGTDAREFAPISTTEDKGLIKALKQRLPKLNSLARKDQESLVAVIDGLLAKTSA